MLSIKVKRKRMTQDDCSMNNNTKYNTLSRSNYKTIDIPYKSHCGPNQFILF